jgi:uncharacterized cysteine cluster protein YcgN (CxxCxxCC family)
MGYASAPPILQGSGYEALELPDALTFLSGLAIATIHFMKVEPFWKSKRLQDMDSQEWESLCDGCGRCCLHKLRDEGTGELSFTNISCRLLDLKTCQCRHYETRQLYVPDCVSLTPGNVDEIDWLPPSCAYRRLAEGKGLAWWHPLVSGDANTVHTAGISVVGRAVDERRAGPFEHHIVDWPVRIPRARRPNQEDGK